MQCLPRATETAHPLEQRSSGLLIRQAMNPGRIDQRGRFNLTGCGSMMSGSPGAARDSAAFVPLVLQIRCFGVCNRWAKNTTIGIDRGTADWSRHDARLSRSEYIRL